MEDKKRVTVLIIIALILAITAIALNTANSEIPTSRNLNANQEGAGEVGVVFKPAPIEDKLAEASQESQP
jgi:hypothetical protein